MQLFKDYSTHGVHYRDLQARVHEQKTRNLTLHEAQPIDLDHVRLSKVRGEPRELGIRWNKESKLFISFISIPSDFSFNSLGSFRTLERRT